jgi:hypothetical protein
MSAGTFTVFAIALSTRLQRSLHFQLRAGADLTTVTKDPAAVGAAAERTRQRVTLDRHASCGTVRPADAAPIRKRVHGLDSARHVAGQQADRSAGASRSDDRCEFRRGQSPIAGGRARCTKARPIAVAVERRECSCRGISTDAQYAASVTLRIASAATRRAASPS